MHQKHYNIPVFIPHLGCPHLCIFCSQKKISGAERLPSADEVVGIIDRHLSTMRPGSVIEIAFFGGSFTGIPRGEQKKFLEVAKFYLINGKVHGIRLSTRPDYINNDIVSFLKEHGVSTIELGVQSTAEDVLRRSGRGHTPEHVFAASSIIKNAGMSLGLQMMIGLPGDTLPKAVMTAMDICGIGADFARIYPAVVLKGTELEQMYHRGEYAPLSLEEAVGWSVEILRVFEEHSVPVIRIGLHPAESLISGEAIAAGPFHPSFRELVLSEVWRRLLDGFLKTDESEELTLYVNPQEINYAVGYKSSNKKMLSKKFKRVIFKSDPAVTGRFYGAKYS